uniref:ABC transporter permease subunit n=1 Tax=Acetatifactor sp. TaxID=1872090 RepID=UPI0040574CEA
MRNNVLTIVKKELARFFGDKRLLFSVLMPGILIYILYSIMGDGMMQSFVADEGYVAKAYVQNMPAEFADTLNELSAEWITVDANADLEAIKLEIENKEADVLLAFPEAFMDKIAMYDVTTGAAAPNVEIYYNSADNESSDFRSILVSLLNAFESSMANKMDINAGEQDYDCATDEDVMAQMFAMMLPMLLIIFLYSGCMSVAPESIAGEKERGTIATLLVTPMKRSSLALGKIISLSVMALLSGISSFLGTMLSLPKLMGDSAPGISVSVYSVADYALLLGIILTTVMVLISAIAVLSALAKNVKEAGTLVSPLMIVIMFVGLMPMFGGETAKDLYQFLIPVNNSVQSMHGIFSFSYDPVNIAVTMVVNIVVAGALTFVLTKLFDSEKVMFAK